MNKDNLEYTINIYEYTTADKKIEKFAYTISLFADVQVLHSSEKKEYLFSAPVGITYNPTAKDIVDCVVKSENIADFLDSSIVKEALDNLNRFNNSSNLTYTNVSKY